MVDTLIANAWRSTAAEDKVQRVFGEVKRKFPIVPNIKAEIVKLILEIEYRTQNLETH